MGVLDAFIKENKVPLDLSEIVASDFEAIESAVAPSSVYKYYGRARVGFFDRPQVRFTQRLALNDPFELAKRWETFGAAPIRDLFVRHLREACLPLFHRTDIIWEMLAEELRKRGVTPTPGNLLSLGLCSTAMRELNSFKHKLE